MNWLLYVMLGGVVLLIISVTILAIATGAKLGVWQLRQKKKQHKRRK